MNQGKLEVVKQEMARVNVDILGISELKWTGMGEFNRELPRVPLQHYWLGIDLDYCDTEGSALETNRDHSVVFEIASKYCISDSFVDHDGHSISSEGFLPAVVDIMVI